MAASSDLGKKPKFSIAGHSRWLHQIAIQTGIHPFWYNDVDVF
jgi:hypothetical protein